MINGKSVSLCMVIYNSSELAQNAIDSVGDIIDEVVIVDQGSSIEESTALKSLADVYVKTTNKGNADFDRQYCYAMATKDYVLALDADECIDKENIVKLDDIFKYDFDIMWFLFKNKCVHGDLTIDLKEILGGDDPHPRLWKRQIDTGGGRMQTPIFWPHGAHQFPQIASERQIFSDCSVNHTRQLSNIIKTHLHRRKNIDAKAQEQERNFVNQVLIKCPIDIKKEMNSQFPELKSYLKG